MGFMQAYRSDLLSLVQGQLWLWRAWILLLQNLLPQGEKRRGETGEQDSPLYILQNYTV